MGKVSVLDLTSIIFFAMGVTSDCNIIGRSEWGARAPKQQESPLKSIPPPYIVIHHSATHTCENATSCKQLVKSIQDYHMDTRGWVDIGYNFLVGGDGSIYEGRGYTTKGAHCPAFNARSLGICLLGNFKENLPSEKQLEAVKEFLRCAEENNHISGDYRLLGHRQSSATECPGRNLFQEIKKWAHYDPMPV